MSLKVRRLSVPTQILVESEKEFVRRVIDIANVYYSPDDRIDGIEYEIFEAMIWANKELGTINSAAAETFVKAYIEKPNMDRKSYDRYRRRLKEKGWLLHDGQYYQLLGIFSSGDGCLFGKNGLKKTATIPLMVIRN